MILGILAGGLRTYSPPVNCPKHHKRNPIASVSRLISAPQSTVVTRQRPVAPARFIGLPSQRPVVRRQLFVLPAQRPCARWQQVVVWSGWPVAFPQWLRRPLDQVWLRTGAFVKCPVGVVEFQQFLIFLHQHLHAGFGCQRPGFFCHLDGFGETADF